MEDLIGFSAVGCQAEEPSIHGHEDVGSSAGAVQDVPRRLTPHGERAVLPMCEVAPVNPTVLKARS